MSADPLSRVASWLSHETPTSRPTDDPLPAMFADKHRAGAGTLSTACRSRRSRC